MQLFALRVSVLLAVASLAACDTTGEGPEFYTGAFAYAEIHLDPSIVRPGETAQAHLIAIGAHGQVLGEVESGWAGDDPAVAVVDSDGRIHAETVGIVTLSTTATPGPHDRVLVVTPAEACGMASSIADWWLQGSFTWHDTASSGDSTISTNHVANWSINAREPRQVNTSEIEWRFRAPLMGATFSLEVNDTFQVDTAGWIQRIHAPGGEPNSFLGRVILDIEGCELYTRIYPSKSDSAFKRRPGLPDSLTNGYPAGGWQPFGTPRVDASAITSSVPIAFGGDLPILPPTDSDVGEGYAPTGYAAYVALWKPGRAPVAVTMSGTPAWEGIALSTR